MALDLSAPAYLPQLWSGTLSGTAGRVTKVTVASKPRVYTVLAGASALVVGWGSQTEANGLADDAVASGSFLDSHKVDIAAGGSLDIPLGPNAADGLESPNAFFIWSAVVSAPYAVTVAPARVS